MHSSPAVASLLQRAPQAPAEHEKVHQLKCLDRASHRTSAPSSAAFRRVRSFDSVGKFDPFSDGDASLEVGSWAVPAATRSAAALPQSDKFTQSDGFTEFVFHNLQKLGKALVAEHAKFCKEDHEPRWTPKSAFQTSHETRSCMTTGGSHLDASKVDPDDLSPPKTDVSAFTDVIPAPPPLPGQPFIDNSAAAACISSATLLDISSSGSVQFLEDSQTPGSPGTRRKREPFALLPGWLPRRELASVVAERKTHEFPDDESDEDEVGKDLHAAAACFSVYPMVEPGWKPRTAWDFCAAFCTFYECIVIPIQFIGDRAPWMAPIGWITRLFWSMDMPLQFCTGFWDSEGRKEMRPNIVAMRYLATWFWIDSVALTADWLSIMVGSSSMALAPRVTKVFRIARILRLMRLTRIFRSKGVRAFSRVVVESVVSPDLVNVTMSFVRIVLFFSWLNHIIACIWVYLGKNTDDPPEDPAHSSFRAKNWVYGHRIEDETDYYLYLCGFHWSLQQFSGAAELWPWNHTERAFALFSGVLCFVMATYIGASLTSTMTHFEILTSHDSKRLADLKNYIDENNISTPVAIRVLRNAQYALVQTKKRIPESRIDLLNIISVPLQMEVHYEVRMPVLSSHPFFREYSHVNPRMMQQVCQYAVFPVELSKGDILFAAGEVSAQGCMYFMVGGDMKYRHRHGQKAIVRPGAWVAEGGLWVHWIYCGTLNAKEECSLFMIDTHHFQHTAFLFQKDIAFARGYGAAFVEHLNSVQHDPNLTDLADSEADALRRVSNAKPDEGEYVETFTQKFSMVKLLSASKNLKERQSNETENVDRTTPSTMSEADKQSPTTPRAQADQAGSIW